MVFPSSPVAAAVVLKRRGAGEKVAGRESGGTRLVKLLSYLLSE